VQAAIPFHLLAKPTGAACNLDCRYCFFLSKDSLYPDGPARMSEALLERYVQQLLASSPGPEVNIAWQGGEPTLMGLDFFRRAAELAARHRRPGQKVLHSLQTNGILIDEAWARFLKEHGFLVGLSVDGPQPLHDAYRVNKAGRGSHQRVLRAWQLLRRHDVDVNILCTVHAANADHGLALYRYFRDELKAQFLQFIPIVERAGEHMVTFAPGSTTARSRDPRPLYRQQGTQVSARSVRPQQWGRFLIEIFDEWVQRDVGRVFVQSFDAALANWLGRPSLCVFSRHCGNALALERNGDLYACDHYVEPGFLLGNIGQRPLAELVALPAQRRFGLDKFDTLPRACRECDVLFACYGECPRNRLASTADGEPGLNYLCDGYKAFFRHIDAPMRRMVELLRQGRLAEEIMPAVARSTTAAPPPLARPGRNEPCPCGSGSKYKHCHGRPAR